MSEKLRSPSDRAVSLKAAHRNFRMSDALERRRAVAAQVLGEEPRIVMRLAYHFGWVVMAKGFEAFLENNPLTVKVEFVRALELGELWNETMSRCNLSPGHEDFLRRMSKKLGRPDGELIRTAIMLGFDAMGEGFRVNFPWRPHRLVQLVNLQRAEEKKSKRKKAGAAWTSRPVVRKRKRKLNPK